MNTEEKAIEAPEAENETQSRKTTPRGPTTCVRFSEKEHQQINKDSQVTGKSIPTLLKKAYFSYRRPRILMTHEERIELFRELRHWRECLIQLGERVNTGFFEGWYPEFQAISQSLVSIERRVLSVYGRR